MRKLTKHFKNKIFLIGFVFIFFQFFLGTNYFPYEIREDQINWDLMSDGKYSTSRGKYWNPYIEADDNNGEPHSFNPQYMPTPNKIIINKIFSENPKFKIGWYSICFERKMSWLFDYSYWDRYGWECRAVVGFRTENDIDLFDYHNTLKNIKDRYVYYAIANYMFLVVSVFCFLIYFSYLLIRKIYSSKDLKDET
jgi:hypothetical protein